MLNLLTRFVASLDHARQPRSGRNTSRQVRSNVAATVEILDSLRMMSATPITDMTQWAQQFPAPTHTQEVWLNFDGKHNDGQSISSFVPMPGQNRDAAIQDVLYRVQEIYSPFNVQIRRITGDGTYSKSNGDTTIFIGGNLANITGPASGSTDYHKNPASVTPGKYMDYPTPSNLNHVPNSDPYDLAFVDPMSGSGTSAQVNDPTKWSNGWGDETIASNIAHEAGHTFGLAHVRTDGLSDPSALGTSTLGDIMSYNTQIPQTFFANRSLPVTSWNYLVGSGLKLTPDILPTSHMDRTILGFHMQFPVSITTENTFTYLQTVLGKRFSDGYAHTSDPNAVDPASTNQHSIPSFTVGTGSVPNGSSSLSGVLNHIGDFDAYSISTAQTRQFHIDVKPTALGLPDADVMVKDSLGNPLFFNKAATFWGTAHIDFQANAGSTYYVVVGGADSSGQGGFTMTVSNNPPVPLIVGQVLNFPAMSTPGIQSGRMIVQSENINDGSFAGVYYDYLGIGIPVTGQISGTTSSSTGIQTSNFTMSGSTRSGIMQASVQFNGTMTGLGSQETLTGSLTDHVVFNRVTANR